LWQKCFRFLPRKANQRGIHEHILDSGELGIETRAEFKQRPDATVVPDVSMRQLERARDDLQERGFATAIWTDDARGGASFDFEADVPECPEFAVPLPTATRQ